MHGPLRINSFSTNVPLMKKQGSWLLLACLKNTCGRVNFRMSLFGFLKFDDLKI